MRDQYSCAAGAVLAYIVPGPLSALSEPINLKSSSLCVLKPGM